MRPFEARADRSQVERLLELTSAASKEKLAATDLARFDLDRPSLTVTLGDQRFAFGTVNPLNQEQYVLAGDARVPAALLLCVAGAAESRAPPDPLPCSSRARRRSPSSSRLPHRAARPEMGARLPAAAQGRAQPGRLQPLGGGVALRFQPAHAARRQQRSERAHRGAPERRPHAQARVLQKDARADPGAPRREASVLLFGRDGQAPDDSAGGPCAGQRCGHLRSAGRRPATSPQPGQAR